MDDVQLARKLFERATETAKETNRSKTFTYPEWDSLPMNIQLVWVSVAKEAKESLAADVSNYLNEHKETTDVPIE